MNGAEFILKTAAQAGIDTCFTNLGTTELPLALAFGSVPEIKPVLGLFEGVCTGAADGYGRMLDRPALTLTHLGPGFANGIANLHNAKRAGTPVVNLVGQHMSSHISLDPPLAMDIEALAGTLGWYKSCKSPSELSASLAEAIAASRFGRIATCIVPHDYQEQSIDAPVAAPEFSFDLLDESCIAGAVKLLRRHAKTALLIGGRALRSPGLQAAARIRQQTGCDILADYLPGFMERGAGFPEITRIPYFPEDALALLSGYACVVICGTREPVGFFGHRGFSGAYLTEGQPRIVLSTERQNPVEALESLAKSLGCPKDVSPSVLAEPRHPSPARGELTAEKACQTLAALQPEGAIIVDEGISSAFSYYAMSSGLSPHSMLTIAGGAIGYGMPCSIGAAVACPDRPVINLQADGSAMYTVQALWTQARQKLNITTLLCSNRTYNILKLELQRAGVPTTCPTISAIFDLDDPRIGWAQLAGALGVQSAAARTGEELEREIKRALSEPGPHLIEIILP